MSFVCTNCGKRAITAPHVTVTGRKLDDDCWARLTEATAGLVAGGGTGGAIATAGWFGRLRKARCLMSPTGK